MSCPAFGVIGFLSILRWAMKSAASSAPMTIASSSSAVNSPVPIRSASRARER